MNPTINHLITIYSLPDWFTGSLATKIIRKNTRCQRHWVYTCMHWKEGWRNQWENRTHEWMNEWINQSIHQSINQSINQSSQINDTNQIKIILDRYNRKKRNPIKHSSLHVSNKNNQHATLSEQKLDKSTFRPWQPATQLKMNILHELHLEWIHFNRNMLCICLGKHGKTLT